MDPALLSLRKEAGTSTQVSRTTGKSAVIGRTGRPYLGKGKSSYVPWATSSLAILSMDPFLC
jgi:putative protein kinase ArgK-like GTPase of G3E family